MKIIKSLLTTLILFVVMCENSYAQNMAYRGYSASAEIGGNVYLGKENAGGEFSFLTSHGYKYGDGSYIGVALGLEKKIGDDTIGVPFWLETKYSFFNSLVRPFVSARAGLDYLIEDTVLYVINPSIGIEVHSFFFRAGYCFAGGSHGATLLKGSKVGFSFGVQFK